MCRSSKLFDKDDKWSDKWSGGGQVFEFDLLFVTLYCGLGTLTFPVESLWNTIQIIYPTNFVVKVKKERKIVTVFKSLGHKKYVIDLSFLVYVVKCLLVKPRNFHLNWDKVTEGQVSFIFSQRTHSMFRIDYFTTYDPT